MLSVAQPTPTPPQASHTSMSPFPKAWHQWPQPRKLSAPCSLLPAFSCVTLTIHVLCTHLPLSLPVFFAFNYSSSSSSSSSSPSSFPLPSSPSLPLFLLLLPVQPRVSHVLGVRHSAPELCLCKNISQTLSTCNTRGGCADGRGYKNKPRHSLLVPT